VESFDEGQKVTVTVMGTIMTDNSGVISVKEQGSGKVTYFFKNAVTSVVEVEAPLIPGKAYEDADGDVLIYRYDAGDTDRPWVDDRGSLVVADYPTLPVKLLTLAG
jgi:hypothetical protein